MYNISERKLDSSLHYEDDNISKDWIEKLKPSAKNRLICKKYKNLYSFDFNNDLSKYGIKDDNKSEHLKTHSNKDNSDEDVWNRIVTQTMSQKDPGKNEKIDKASKFHISLHDVSRSEHHEEILASKNMKSVHNSFYSENHVIQNYEEVNNIIEEKYKKTLSENKFLRQENHSIIPFLLISNKEVHRMCLSDYEIKMITKIYKKKLKKSELEAHDYYRMGLINFYRGKHNQAYVNLKSAYAMKENDVNIAKWLAFISIVIIMCEKNKLEFENIKKKKFAEEGNEEDITDDLFLNTFFSCCSTRNRNIGQLKTVKTNISRNDHFINMNEELLKDKNEPSVNKKQIAKEIVPLLKFIINSNKNENMDNKINHELECWWLFIFIGVFTTLHPTQPYFNLTAISNDNKIYEPKFCIRKIQEIDSYLAYLAYSDYQYYATENFSIDKLLKQLLSKYSDKAAAYLRYWQLLIKGKYKNYDLANSISEIYWKNCSAINYEDSIY